MYIIREPERDSKTQAIAFNLCTHFWLINKTIKNRHKHISKKEEHPRPCSPSWGYGTIMILSNQQFTSMQQAGVP